MPVVLDLYCNSSRDNNRLSSIQTIVIVIIIVVWDKSYPYHYLYVLPTLHTVHSVLLTTTYLWDCGYRRLRWSWYLDQASPSRVRVWQLGEGVWFLVWRRRVSVILPWCVPYPLVCGWDNGPQLAPTTLSSPSHLYPHPSPQWWIPLASTDLPRDPPAPQYSLPKSTASSPESPLIPHCPLQQCGKLAHSFYWVLNLVQPVLQRNAETLGAEVGMVQVEVHG